jgi:hypothetical protein
LAFVRIDRSLDDVLAQSPGCVDEHDVSKPVSVSIENITPAPSESERIIAGTPIESAIFR